MAKKGENIYKRKDGRWEGRYIRFYDENAKAKYGYVYAKTYSEVKQKLLECKTTPAKATLYSWNNTVSYDEILDSWLQSSKFKIKESTYARYLHLINSHIRPHLGKYPTSQISTQIIECFIEDKLQKGRLNDYGALSPKTVTDILSIIKNSMEYAKYHDVTVVCNLNRLTIKKHDKEIRVLSSDEQADLSKVLLQNMDTYKFGVFLALYTGIRIGELCALQWNDIDMQQSVLKVNKTLQRIQNTDRQAKTKTKIIISEPKSKCSCREIPLPPFLIEIMEQFQSNPLTYVLSGTSTKYIEPRTMQNKFKMYCWESGIENANFHCLRHTFATRCVEVGFDVKSLSEILGHANVNITLNRYVHSSFDFKYHNMNKLSGSFMPSL